MNEVETPQLTKAEKISLFNQEYKDNRELNHQHIVEYLTNKLNDCNGNKKVSPNQALLKKTGSFANFSPQISFDGHKACETLIEKIKRMIANNETWFSLEFFPPKTVNGASNLISK
jgi:hypothetical protein